MQRYYGDFESDRTHVNRFICNRTLQYFLSLSFTFSSVASLTTFKAMGLYPYSQDPVICYAASAFFDFLTGYLTGFGPFQRHRFFICLMMPQALAQFFFTAPRAFRTFL